MDLSVEARDQLGHHPAEEVLLAADVRVDQLLVRARAPGDAGDPRTGDAVACELAGGGVEDASSGRFRIAGHAVGAA